MRISDWSSDVCSPDLERVASLDQWYGDLEALPRRQRLWRLAAIPVIELQDGVGHPLPRTVRGDPAQSYREEGRRQIHLDLQLELRELAAPCLGKQSVSTGRSRRSPYHDNKISQYTHKI